MGWGARLKLIRERAGLEQAEFGALFGKSQQTVSTWENEGVKQPNPRWYQELARLIEGVDIHWAMTGEGGEPESASRSGDNPFIERNLMRGVIIVAERFWQRGKIVDMSPTEKADEIMRLSHVAQRDGIEAVEAMLERIHRRGGK